MRKSGLTTIIITIAFLLLLLPSRASEKGANDSTLMIPFIRTEIHTGVFYNLHRERDQVRTKDTNDLEKLTSHSLKFRWAHRRWKYHTFRQEEWEYQLQAGPFYGEGSLLDSSASQVIDASQTVTGLRTNASARYSSRFYYNSRSYTIVKVNAWGRYDLFKRKEDGTFLDSSRVESPWLEKTNQSKLRMGIEAEGGWGWGRLSPVNDMMKAEYLLQKYYAGRVFSEKEVLLFAREIARIKNRRNARLGHHPEKEAEQVKTYLNRKMMLEAPENIAADWQAGEFLPRLKGTRMEAGPFFNYYNMEPDFVWGGYLSIENARYCSLNRNRNIAARLSYNSYKRQDWLRLEVDLGWDFYPGINSQYGFGVKYVPGVVVHDIDDYGTIRHHVIPYLNYYSQINPKYRMDLAFSWRLAQNDKFMMPGPEVSVSFYRSKY